MCVFVFSRMIQKHRDEWDVPFLVLPSYKIWNWQLENWLSLVQVANLRWWRSAVRWREQSVWTRAKPSLHAEEVNANSWCTSWMKCGLNQLAWAVFVPLSSVRLLTCTIWTASPPELSPGRAFQSWRWFSPTAHNRMASPVRTNAAHLIHLCVFEPF